VGFASSTPASAFAIRARAARTFGASFTWTTPVWNVPTAGGLAVGLPVAHATVATVRAAIAANPATTATKCFLLISPSFTFAPSAKAPIVTLSGGAY
jgi:hypothetical protein